MVPGALFTVPDAIGGMFVADEVLLDLSFGAAVARLAALLTGTWRAWPGSRGCMALTVWVRRYPRGIQRRPDRFANWRDRQSLVRVRSHGTQGRQPGWLPSVAF